MLRVPRLADRVLVIAHRGASAVRPEHTLEAYRQAIFDGADIIEPDLVSTRDGVLVARHENEISGTTNVADLPQFAQRRTQRTIDGEQLTGWFTEDFTLAELKTLRARERIPAIRPHNMVWNDQFEIPTLTEIIHLVHSLSTKLGRTIGIYPETKHTSHFRSVGLPLEETLLNTLARQWQPANGQVFIQSFETGNLRALRNIIGTRHPFIQLVQLLGQDEAQPFDWLAAGDNRTYASCMTPAGLTEISAYADAIGPDKGALTAHPELIGAAHALDLLVHPYTVRPENAFLPAHLRGPGGDGERYRPGIDAELKIMLDAGIDGVFIDDPAIGRAAVDQYLFSAT
jgi:glycerophosphoryl diester phosphodiesterase